LLIRCFQLSLLIIAPLPPPHCPLVSGSCCWFSAIVIVNVNYSYCFIIVLIFFLIVFILFVNVIVVKY
jgi:hypothetical protein